MRDDSLTGAQLAVARSARVATLLRRCGDDLGVPAASTLAVRLTDDAALRELNRRFRSQDEPTDVLAFPASESVVPHGAHVGDVAISLQRAIAQDSAHPEQEVRLLAVHGLLHCLGHDHSDVASAAAMTGLTRRLLPDQPVPTL